MATRKKAVVDTTDEKSLGEVNSSIAVPKNAGFWRTLLAFSGPGALVAVGYMDPGNWITSIVGGAKYQYLLLSVVLISSLIAMILQYMAGKLGIVTEMDLAQNTRARTGKKTGIFLWIITELAIMATDIAEVIGSGIALHLLFGMSILQGVILTAFDVLILLLLMKLGFRKIEAIVGTLITTIVLIFVYLTLMADPNWAGVLAGYLPQPEVLNNHVSHGDSQLVMAAGIIGATVMPHNLYLHSSISQTRKIDHSKKSEVKQAVRFMMWDSNIQLSMAFIVNSMLLILGAALFFGHGDDLQAFGALYDALKDKNIAGAIASPVLSTLFAVALLASGQNSTITGTLTGEAVMEGFLRLRVPRWIRRLITRGLAIAPVIAFAIAFGGSEGKLDQLLVYSQVFLSIALPFSMIPLIYFTSSKKVMGKEFVNPKWLIWVASIAAAIITLLNVQIVIKIFTELGGVLF
ncbi:MAG: Nramp family divalent metal transporter [Lactobacillaceae bacterium]|jgi:manganese transport protein|nr:Nramp family divalent metal transporter [Lactobacillaceae bacterium]